MTIYEIKIKLALERKVLERGAAIVGIHSVVVEDGVVFAGFDIEHNRLGDGVLFFEFPLPSLIGRADIREFVGWLASSSWGEAVH